MVKAIRPTWKKAISSRIKWERTKWCFEKSNKIIGELVCYTCLALPLWMGRVSFFLWYSDCTAVKLKISYKISGPVFAFIKRIINESKWNIHHVPSVISLVIETVYFMKLSAIIRIVAVWNGQANWSKWKSIWSCIRLNFSFPKTDQTKLKMPMKCVVIHTMLWTKYGRRDKKITTQQQQKTHLPHIFDIEDVQMCAHADTAFFFSLEGKAILLIICVDRSMICVGRFWSSSYLCAFCLHM